MYTLRWKYFTDKYTIQIGKKGEGTYMPKFLYFYPNHFQVAQYAMFKTNC
jgi:hypothetical protein